MKESQSTYHRPVRLPGRRTLERLLAAAEDQLREEDLDAFTVQNVVARTGHSVGAFYSRFPDKTSLLHAVQVRTHERLEPRIAAALAAEMKVRRSLEEAVERGFGILIEHVMEERDLTRAFMMRSVFDPVARAKGDAVNVARQRAMTQLLMHYRDEIGHDDPERAIHTAYAMYYTSLRGRLVYFSSETELQDGVSDDTIFSLVKWSIGVFLRNDPDSGVSRTAPS
jgi:AcrR family transcriptional regulator